MLGSYVLYHLLHSGHSHNLYHCWESAKRAGSDIPLREVDEPTAVTLIIKLEGLITDPETYTPFAMRQLALVQDGAGKTWRTSRFTRLVGEWCCESIGGVQVFEDWVVRCLARFEGKNGFVWRHSLAQSKFLLRIVPVTSFCHTIISFLAHGLKGSSLSSSQVSDPSDTRGSKPWLIPQPPIQQDFSLVPSCSSRSQNMAPSIAIQELLRKWSALPAPSFKFHLWKMTISGATLAWVLHPYVPLLKE
jgi:hypothetical protein